MKTSTMEHLDKRTIAFLEECQELSDPKPKKIAFVQETPWIMHKDVASIWESMEDILEHARNHRMPDLNIVARSNSGKTTLLKRFAKKHEAVLDKQTGELTAPVIAAVMPHYPTEILFIDELLGAVQLKTKRTDTFPNKLAQMYKVLERVDCKVILIDEIQHIGAGSTREQHLITNMLKNMSSILQLSFITAGTPEALNIFSFDSQFKSRFKPAVIPTWSPGDELESLLASFEALLPLEEPSDLASDELIDYILTHTDRTIGDIYDLLKESTVYAIKNGQKKLSIPVMEKSKHMSPQKIEAVKKKLNS